MADKPSIDPQLHAAAIADATKHLNESIGAAWDAGLIVSVDVLRQSVFGRADDRPIVQVRVAAPL